MRKLFLAILALWLAFAAQAEATDSLQRYEAAKVRAARFFKYQEWQSALAMYEVMLSLRPDDVASCYHAIFTSGMLGNQDEQMRFFEHTQKHGIALDSIFSGVKHISFAMGEGDEYEKLLLLVRERQPWLTRGINVYLLEYYDFRNDAQGVIGIAESMLNDTPESLQLAHILARAYMMASRPVDALRCYRYIVARQPHDYDALLNMGVYYYTALDSTTDAALRSDYAALAQAYLTDAWRVNPTPHVAKILQKLSKL
ncbi:MAG: hypothetical protein ACI4UN_02780 [Muribaculaceae bacterium]